MTVLILNLSFTVASLKQLKVYYSNNAITHVYNHNEVFLFFRGGVHMRYNKYKYNIDAYCTYIQYYAFYFFMAVVGLC